MDDGINPIVYMWSLQCGVVQGGCNWSEQGIGVSTASLYGALLGSRVITLVVTSSVRKLCKVTL